MNNNIASTVILTNSHHAKGNQKVKQIRIAFDGDAVLFGSDSERVSGLHPVQSRVVYSGGRGNISETCKWLLQVRMLHTRSKAGALVSAPAFLSNTLTFELATFIVPL